MPASCLWAGGPLLQFTQKATVVLAPIIQKPMPRCLVTAWATPFWTEGHLTKTTQRLRENPGRATSTAKSSLNKRKAAPMMASRFLAEPSFF